MVQRSFKARQMVPGQDNITTIALHYGLKPSQVRDIIKQAGVEVIRYDGHQGRLVNLTTAMISASGTTTAKIRSVVWDDAQPFDPETTKLTRPAIMAVARWKYENTEDENL